LQIFRAAVTELGDAPPDQLVAFISLPTCTPSSCQNDSSLRERAKEKAAENSVQIMTYANPVSVGTLLAFYMLGSRRRHGLPGR
jgi:hypothetical protein